MLFVSRVACWPDFSKVPRQRAFLRVGFVLFLLILLRLDCAHTRLVSLRAVNLNHPVDILSVSVFCRRLFSLCFRSFDFCSGCSRAFGWPGVPSCLLFSSFFVSCRPLFAVFGWALIFSLSLSSSRPLSLRFGRASLPLSPSLSSLCCVCLPPPRVGRRTLTWTCSDHVQLGPPVDLCVRELSLPLSSVNRGLRCAW